MQHEGSETAGAILDRFVHLFPDDPRSQGPHADLDAYAFKFSETLNTWCPGSDYSFLTRTVLGSRFGLVVAFPTSFHEDFPVPDAETLVERALKVALSRERALKVALSCEREDSGFLDGTARKSPVLGLFCGRFLYIIKRAEPSLWREADAFGEATWIAGTSFVSGWSLRMKEGG